MPVSDDEIYRQLAADYLHHLRWREKLFGGFLVLVGALALGFYHTHKRDQRGEFWFQYGWVLPVVGLVLSIAFFFLDRRCQEVLRDRRTVGEALETQARRGLFDSVVRMGRDARLPTHTHVLQFLYLAGAAGFFLLLVTSVVWRACGQ